jgi:poly(A) polymerase
MKLDVAKWRRRKGMKPLLGALDAAEGMTRYVGGAVRDELLGLPVSDVDLATRLRPDQVVERLQAAGIKVVPTGFDHGTITAVSSGQVVEVTTLRRDVTTDGRRATIEYSDDWREDAARRDFTINAISADPMTGELFDYFRGLADLEQRHVRFIGEPLARIAEDHLRILRFFRFHARFGAGDPDPAALAACTERAKDLMALSRERVADELLKLLGLPDPSPTVAIMLDRGILAPVLPEIEPTALGSLRRLIAAEAEAGIEPAPLRRLASLLPPDPVAAEKIAIRLRLSNKARKRLGCVAGPSAEPNPRALAYRLGTDCAVDRLLIAGKTKEAAAIASWAVPKLPISGGTLIKRGLAEGPIVASTLKRIDQRWADADFPDGEAFDRIVADALGEAAPG